MDHLHQAYLVGLTGVEATVRVVRPFSSSLRRESPPVIFRLAQVCPGLRLRALVGASSRSAIEADSPAMGGQGRAHHQGSNLN